MNTPSSGPRPFPWIVDEVDAAKFLLNLKYGKNRDAVHARAWLNERWGKRSLQPVARALQGIPEER